MAQPEELLTTTAAIQLPADDDALVDERVAAAFLNLSHRTLQLWRVRRSDLLPFVRLGSAVRYRVADLRAFVLGNRRWSTSDPGAAAPAVGG
jgi:hypothetical protein